MSYPANAAAYFFYWADLITINQLAKLENSVDIALQNGVNAEEILIEIAEEDPDIKRNRTYKKITKKVGKGK